MFARIGDNLPRCQVYQSLFPSHGRLLQAISVVYLDIIYFCVDAKTTFRKLKKSTTGKVFTFLLPIPRLTYILIVPFILKSLWKDFNSEFEDTLTKFRHHIKNVEKEVMLSNTIEDSNARALCQADRARKERQRRGKLLMIEE